MTDPSKSQVSVPKERRYAVLMAGGSGTRFWPWSRRTRPKQLLALAGRDSMLRETVERVRGLVPDSNVIVVTGSPLREAVAADLPYVDAGSILCEPEGRNTAACVGWAALEVASRDPEGVMVVLPADHVVGPPEIFEAALEAAMTVADRSRRLVTFGIRPDEPAVGYGYIRTGEPLSDGASAYSVASFHEKPTPERAQEFLDSGEYYWNSGMFAWRADVILEELAKHLPQLSRDLNAMEARRENGSIEQAVVDECYPGLESISIDHGVMERSDRAAMLPAAFSWSDIGSWDAVAELWPEDGDGNRSRDRVISVDSGGNVVATGKPVALLGVRDLVVVDSGDALLVCPRDRAQHVRKIVDALRAGDIEELL
jgi:mannose-1-phosphate guanylyltransferase